MELQVGENHVRSSQTANTILDSAQTDNGVSVQIVAMW